MEEVISDKNENKLICGYYDKGYCMYKDKCKYVHPKEVCQKSFCKGKKCFRRHPKSCRYKQHCRRGSNCLYMHAVARNSNEG